MSRRGVATCRESLLKMDRRVLSIQSHVVSGYVGELRALR